MGILRVNQISGTETQLSTLGIGTTASVTGSVFFDGSGDSITVSPTNSLFLDKVFTIEFWAFPNSSAAVNGDSPTILSFPTSSGINTTKVYISSTSNFFGLHNGTSDVVSTGTSSLVLNTWSHVAITRDSSDTCRIFLNGSLINSATSTVAFGNTTTSLRIGSLTASNGSYNGFISNLRIRKGTAGYTTSFTPPTLILEEIGDTSLLCCNNADSAGAAVGTAVTASPLTLVGNTTSFSNNPGLVRNFTSGTQFTGVTRLDTQGFIVPPSGTTAQSNRGRGLFGGGYVPGSSQNTIQFINIQSQGNAQKFGELSSNMGSADGKAPCAAASATRALFASGFSSPAPVNTMEYVTIATTSNSVDFGDLATNRRDLSACSSSTRALFGGGTTTASTNTTNAIDFVTIASLGNAVSFGNLTQARRGAGSCASPTRGIWSGGYVAPFSNRIDFVTIATTGNATTFGDLTNARFRAIAVSSSTRGVFAGGTTDPAFNLSSRIDFVTIASTGNAILFGDLTQARARSGSCSNSIRGVFGGGYTPASVNTLDFVTISSTGNATDFGDLLSGCSIQSGGCSDSHGGIS